MRQSMICLDKIKPLNVQHKKYPWRVKTFNETQNVKLQDITVYRKNKGNLGKKKEEET